MSEKRFAYGRKNDMNFGYCPHCIRDLQEDKIFTDYTEIADLLNQLDEENEQLRQYNEHLEIGNKNLMKKNEKWITMLEENLLAMNYTNENLEEMLKFVQNENEQLRHELQMEKKWQIEKDTYYVQLKEENEQLKKELQDKKIYCKMREMYE